MNQKTVFIAAALSLVVAFVAGVLFFNARQDEAARALAETNRAALVRMHSPTIGPANAPVTIVEFLDPACETCAAFYPRVKALLAKHPGQIRLVLRYAPFHNGSDKVVAALEAARRQDKLWPALEALLASQPEWAPHHTPQLALALKPLESVGLDMSRLAFDLTAPDIAQVIAQDLADAQTLKVSKTPEFFVNGEPLPSFGFAQLEALVAQALAKAK